MSHHDPDAVVEGLEHVDEEVLDAIDLVLDAAKEDTAVRNFLVAQLGAGPLVVDCGEGPCRYCGDDGGEDGPWEGELCDECSLILEDAGAWELSDEQKRQIVAWDRTEDHPEDMPSASAWCGFCHANITYQGDGVWAHDPPYGEHEEDTWPVNDRLSVTDRKSRRVES